MQYWAMPSPRFSSQGGALAGFMGLQVRMVALGILSLGTFTLCLAIHKEPYRAMLITMYALCARCCMNVMCS